MLRSSTPSSCAMLCLCSFWWVTLHDAGTELARLASAAVGHCRWHRRAQLAVCSTGGGDAYVHRTVLLAAMLDTLTVTEFLVRLHEWVKEPSSRLAWVVSARVADSAGSMRSALQTLLHLKCSMLGRCCGHVTTPAAASACESNLQPADVTWQSFAGLPDSVRQCQAGCVTETPRVREFKTGS
jgi:hypothetical protein